MTTATAPGSSPAGAPKKPHLYWIIAEIPRTRLFSHQWPVFGVHVRKAEVILSGVRESEESGNAPLLDLPNHRELGAPTRNPPRLRFLKHLDKVIQLESDTGVVWKMRDEMSRSAN
jgi:hypothetical protein